LSLKYFEDSIAFLQQMKTIFVIQKQQHLPKMKKGLLALATSSLLIVSCSSMKNKAAAQTDKAQIASLAGTWELDIIPYSKGPFDSLYKDKKPTLTFDPEKKSFYGYTGCNGLNGPLDTDGNKINFKGDITMTLKACFGDGESVFMENLKRINQYSVSTDGKELTLIQGDIALMRFHRK
jgi:heat shock protein HslJ